MSWKPSSSVLPCGRSIRGELGLFCNPKNREPVMAMEKNSVVAAMKPVSEDPEGKDGEKSLLSLELSLSTNHEISSSSSSSQNNVKEPILFDFLSTWENDNQVDEAEELATKNQNGLDLGEISLDLKLGCASSCITKKRKKASKNSAIAKLPESSRACGIKRKKPNCREVEKEEKPAASDPWVIKKRMQESDVGDLSRLLLVVDGVKKHILPMWDAKRIEKIKDGVGVHVAVWDCDTKSEKQLKFKKWRNGSYVLVENWTKEFVKRRGLMKGDEVGLYWDQSNSRFNFSILKRAFIDY